MNTEGLLVRPPDATAAQADSLTIDKRVRVRYWPALDGARALAVLAVLGVHSGLAPGGFFGVDVFFVLSGFLITMLLLDEFRRNKTLDLAHFYLRRVLRLLPSALVVLVLAVVVGELLLSRTERNTFGASALAILTYTVNFHSTATNMPLLQHYWSLSLEEQFYFVWPILLLILVAVARLSFRTIAAVLTIGGFAAGIGGIALVLSGGSPEAVGSLPQMRGCGLILGCALAAAFSAGIVPTKERTQTLIRYGSITSVLILAAIMRPFPRDASRPAALGGYLLVSLLTVLVIAAVVTGPEDALLVRLLQLSWLVYLGRLSYCLYLVHLPIFELMTHTHLTAAPRIPLAVLASLLAAWLLHITVEQPALRLKKRIGHQGSRAQVPA